MKKLSVALALSLVLLPTVSFAQTALPNVCNDMSFNFQLGGSDTSTIKAVTDLQAYFISAGFLSGQPTGYFGTLTLAALKKFQTAHNLPATGYFGPMTRAAIKSSVCVNVGVSTNQSTVSQPVSQPATQAGRPASTPAQVAQVAEYCADVEENRIVYNNNGNAQIIPYCQDGSLLAAYPTNSTIRTLVDTAVQQVKAQQQATNAYNQAYVASVNEANTSNQLQQLQSAVNANTAAMRQLQQQSLMQTPTYTAPSTQPLKCTTQPWWNAGVLQYSTTCSPSNY